ncbi:hypothetical protein [Mycolicibacterium confluentis]|uniref:Uncharacterized protein n=1 Tax=Mycolicibacterium confluentis TaxID=28047 RepID=A0A7I7XUR2_9MYCO|nr:hypothetical protein [Mycolicibacterium confluentis]MCV7322320.1 hypothetical protein [Mycolicibacterium confluentis]ORV28361.1 hypothetical protein AWB99_17645 [Mycolicibacterium confluentis]BBZ32995.1 hypothetical protein MCNF_16000 [Mycolicibacterium confluentis]
MMAPGGTDEVVGELDVIAVGFLGSEFAEPTYAGWPIERRLDAYLRRIRRLTSVDHHNGSVYEALLDRVMAHIGRARRAGHRAAGS